jgi:hypothetical protein
VDGPMRHFMPAPSQGGKRPPMPYGLLIERCLMANVAASLRRHLNEHFPRRRPARVGCCPPSVTTPRMQAPHLAAVLKQPANVF